jgi:alcohol dehydrogenase (cytochrome c)
LLALQTFETLAPKPCVAAGGFDRLRRLDYQSKLVPPLVLGVSCFVYAAVGFSQSPGLPVTPDRLLHAEREPGNWLMYSGNYSSHRFSSLDQITSESVGRLHAKWVFQSDVPKMEATPVAVDGILYTVRVPNDVIALDGATGRTLWTYSHKVPADVISCCGLVNRGLAIQGTRLFLETLDAQLLALDARSGRLLWKQTIADYQQGYAGTSAPLVVKDKVIVGVAGGEFGIRGFVDAYYVSTGERAWRFYTVPGKGEPGNETWTGDTWMHGGGATWITGSFDPGLNLVYWGTGNPGPDWNGDVRPGDNLYTCSMLALDADTGKLRWHFQYTPHDTHDWDSVQIPVLVDSTVRGRPHKLLLHPNRNGFYYVLDRETGEYLLAKAFVKQTWAERIDAQGRPVPIPGRDPTEEGNSTTWPGVNGGNNWMSPSYNPITKLLYVMAREELWRFNKAHDVEYRAGEGYAGGGIGMPNGMPPEERWSKVIAIVPETGEIKWEHRLMSPSWAGVLSTAGNLVFSSTLEGNFFALDARTGTELWHFPGGGAISAAPISYLSKGRQYIAISVNSTLMAFGLD